ncbi:MAG: adenylosuccinate lyase [Deltaproteobacteria bacterium]|nr:adenylosuccinate lyase [Deltaproteobacteria bacterium]MBW1736431.1 adenylosuccinate lyase [Deltaproteobacteria bacterium]MBW1907936.1 adenylosuccinate lyase [Deltaproteobacteria bacterium]MBW2033209.1 adenylosuccinate lyase [Deltaproteobacteria bacterium]MBW2113726.1 adenylosuccinate lyase [Deltaproteobacteria bacterium]
MISRYTRPEMGRIWESENRYAKWLEVEVAACEAMAEEGLIPQKAFENIRKKSAFSVDRILEIEEETKHDIIAFLTNVAEHVGPDSRYIHLGLTSSDILDTSFALLLKEAMEFIIQDVREFIEVIKKRAFEHKFTVMIGRSHGIHAEPITFGLKLAVWYSEMKRNLRRLEAAYDVISYGKLSGAVGTFANVSPKVESLVCKKLGLNPAEISTQILQRDRHAEYFASLAIVAGTLEKIAVEIRHLQRTEVLEAEEPFAKGQKGSSAMPHKKNPIGCENITGLARLVRSNCMAAFENMALWHERDISHSSVERIIGPDSTILMDFMLHRLTGIVSGLVVHPHKMAENLKKTKGLIFSQQFLMKLAEKGVERQKAYVMVQKNAMKVWESGQEFKVLIMEDQEIGKYLSKKEIEDVFDVDYHLQHVDDIFARVFN